ncbi:MAG: hypothetical protein WKG07_04335 [Hymenobacter sp.]
MLCWLLTTRAWRRYRARRGHSPRPHFSAQRLEMAKESTGHGSPLPQPGARSAPAGPGGGQEMGGIRGVEHFMQRVALQGFVPSMITAITEVYQTGAKRVEYDKHIPSSATLKRWKSARPAPPTSTP